MIQVILSKPSHLMMRYKGLKPRHRSANGVRSRVKEHGELGERRTLWECANLAFHYRICGTALEISQCSNASLFQCFGEYV
jgi:hypothetical protein